MQVATHRRYGPADVLSIETLPRPDAGPGQILVQVAAAGVTSADWRIRAADFPAFKLPARLLFGLFRPRQPVGGHDFAGRVVGLGAGVTRFRLGAAVFGTAKGGAHAEYLLVDADGAVAAMPEGLGFDEAAAVPFGALAALGYLRDIAHVQRGDRVLIAGATGGVGAYAVQIATAMGAEVTALARSDLHALVRDLGAARAIDYRDTDVTRGSDRFDVVLDTAGVLTWRGVRRILSPNGRFAPLEFGLRDVLRGLFTKRVRVGVTSETRESMAQLADMLADGSVRAVIDSRFALEQIADAHRRVETRHKTGAVVLTLDDRMTRPAAA
ncbi:NAD(P)-dependent alcohol dehydrogenase [Psychromarinibacter halotolerans]|uniref:NAD(P)-dependent alcohol dehydrogenase n=1 Tax=Psychromarinibacter halotolerans TaxID=1775175 RepID=A0ABV7GSB2_9RHOB|nr:NAD(P)-dependent alcohol dehydrogenase [Psychromarinibacter halotolerans]MDF0596986.1 NAD(P)-dependent alcohol dehydrogenase [Psychromarinibacter halotolerans]